MKPYLYQAIFFFAIFHGISWLKETRLLDADGSVKAPDFHLLSYDNEWVSVEDFAGKPTLIYFWAPWCSVCKVSLPNLQNFSDDNQGEINIVTVALSYNNKYEVADILNSKELTLPTLFGNSDVATDYKISAFPTYYILNEDGAIVSKSMGYSSEIGMVLRSLTL